MLDGSTSFMVRKTSTDHKRSYFVGDEDKGNPTGLDTAINEFLPKLEYVSTRIRLRRRLSVQGQKSDRTNALRRAYGNYRRIQ